MRCLVMGERAASLRGVSSMQLLQSSSSSSSSNIFRLHSLLPSATASVNFLNRPAATAVDACAAWEEREREREVVMHGKYL